MQVVKFVGGRRRPAPARSGGEMVTFAILPSNAETVCRADPSPGLDQG